MTKATDPAFPINEDPCTRTHPGLTKREYFAAMAMQAFISDSQGKEKTVWFDDVAKFSCMQADALIAELANVDPEAVWIEWSGCDDAVIPEACVYIYTRDGSTGKGASKLFRWAHTGGPEDIMHYRIVKGGEA